MRLCAKYGITELSNYVLYNSEDFGGKGEKYNADTPKDLYDRMRFTLDLKDEINEKLPIEKKVAAFSFPMRYIPLSAHERGYVGSQWNAKFLRAVQCMLIPTQGKGVGSRSFFEADFGKDADEFVKFLSMPDKLIAARGKFSEKVRGKHNETEEDLEQRKVLWEKNQRKLNEWNSLYALMKEDEIDSFVSLIGDNEYFPEKVLGITSDLQKKMYLHYLTIPRLISLLGMINHNSPTYNVIYKYITNDFDDNFEKNPAYFLLIEQLTTIARVITKDIRTASLGRNSDLSNALAQYEIIQSDAASALNDCIAKEQKGALKQILSGVQQSINNSHSNGESDNLYKEIAFEELDMLIGQIQGATTFKVLNTMKNISNVEKKTLEKVFNAIIEYNKDASTEIIDYILSKYQQGGESIK